MDASLIRLKTAWSTPQLTSAEFEALLGRLHPDREEAGRGYELLRLKLVNFFAWRGILYAEDLADETLNRVARHPAPIQSLNAFALSVARNVLREYWRESRRSLKDPPAVNPAPAEADFARLEAALERLGPEDRLLIMDYFQGGDAIDHRKVMAERRGLSPNALRIKVCRIKDRVLGALRDLSPPGG